MATWNLGLPVATVPSVPEVQPTIPPRPDGPVCDKSYCTQPQCVWEREYGTKNQEEAAEENHDSEVYCETCEEWIPARRISVVDTQVTYSDVRYCVSVTTDSDGDKRLNRSGEPYNTDEGESEVTSFSVVCDECGEELSVYDVDGRRA